MFFTRSVLASATLLSFSATTEGWVLHRKAEEHVAVKRIVANGAQDQWSWRNFFGKRQDEVLECPNDQFAALLSNNPDDSVESFCNDWLNIPPTTIVEEFTPTVTVTTSASTTTTQTITERVLTTRTILETATITASPTVRRRMLAAAQQIESIAESIVNSVIASGTPSATEVATPKGPNRIAAEQGLATACSCRLVSPTSSVTQTFTLPNAVTTTVGGRYLRIVRQTDVITYTSTTTVREAAPTQATADASSSADSVNSRADEEASSSSATESTSAAEESTLVDPVATSIAAGGNSSASSVADEATSSPAITTAPVVATTIAVNSTATVSEGAAVVTAIPFSCDENDLNKSVDQVVGGLRLGYNVYCNTGFSQDRVGRPIIRNTTVADVTACAAQCSLLNAQGVSDACQNALFEPATDGSGGSCSLFSAGDDADSSVETTPAPGSIAIVHTGTFANGDECAALNATAVSIDTSAVVSSITAGGIAISTPGLVGGDAGGGVSATYVSSNSTDASGYVHWSWYSVYASSTSWWAVYETSWACSATITRTIEQPATTIVEGSTITSVIVTTIIGNGYTTIISGNSTTTISGGGGSGGGEATFVPVSTTTDGDGAITTFFSSAAQGSTGTDGIVTPTPVPTPGGQGNVTVSEAFSTFFSTGTEGIISPTASPSLNTSITEDVVVSSTAVTLTISGANSTFFSTGTDGVITPSETPILETTVSSGAVTLTVSGSNATATSDSDSGILSPSSTAVVSTVSEEEEWDTSGIYGPPKTSTIVVASSEIITVTSTGASGVETPTVITAVSSETLVVEISNTTISGNGSFSTFTSTATFNSTGSGGIITPTVVTETITTAAGTGNLTVIVSTATANSTGLSGIIPPTNTLVVTETLNSTAPVPTVTGGFSTEGFGNFSTGSETAFTISTGVSGVIPPASANSTTTPGFTGSTSTDQRTGFLPSPSSSARTSTGNVTASTGVPTPSLNSSIVVETPSVNTTLTLTVPLTTGFTATIEIPSVNTSLPVTSSPSPTAPANSTSVFIGSTSTDQRTGFLPSPSSARVNSTSTLTLPVGTSSIELPIVNSTIVVPETTPTPEASESGSTLVVTTTADITLSFPSGNVTVTLIPPTTRPFDNTTTPSPTPTGNTTSESFVSINWSTVPSFSTGNLSTILPPTSTNISITVETPSVPLNSTTAPPASSTIPAISVNSTTPGFTGSTSTDERTGSLSPPFPTGNSTLPPEPTAPTTEACPSPTEFSFVTREVIITTYTVETIPVVAATCISSGAAPTGLNGTVVVGINGTLPTETAVLSSVVESIASEIASVIATEIAPTSDVTVTTDTAATSEIAATSVAATSEAAATSEEATATSTEAAATSSDVAPVVSDILSATSSVVSDVTASATSEVVGGATEAPLSRFRRSGILATQDQIDAACSDNGNLILSPTLNIQPDSSTEGWFVSQFDPTIPVDSVTTANGTIARFRSAFPGQTTQLSQPVTLCPGTQYQLSALTRQVNTRSDCTVQFRVGNDAVFTARPQTDWLERSERFTAGAGTEGASQDLTMVMSCAGFAGAAVGADAEGYMVGEIGAVSIVREELMG
ncbi:hypothetical protein SVAN01_09192 [Stagonosporopsis vannaccii]|nr:hypothetical protein SVAN01_09192 [Stagonosporopsis vannaccii]